MTKPRLLLTGATGFIGSRLRRDLAQGWDILGTCRACAPGPEFARLDLTDAAQLERVFGEAAPEAVVNAAGMADPDQCEREPDLARRVDRDGPRLLARLCARAGARLVHFSTDLVFDGEGSWYKESDPPRPLGVYGRAKLEAEAAVLDACPSAAVLRVATVYGRALSGRPSFLDTLHRTLSAGEKVLAFVDQWRTATPCGLLPGAVDALLRRRDLGGVFHCAGAQRASRWDFATEVCRVFGFPEALVEPGRAAEARFLSPRPRDTSLNSARLSGLLALPLPSLRRGLEQARREWES